MKLNQKLIQQLRNGEIAVENNGTLEQLREVLKEAFPKYHPPMGSFIFYFMDIVRKSEWIGNDITTLPVKKISDFYETELFTGWAKDDEHPKWMIYFKNDVAKFGFGALGDWLSGIESAFCKYSEDDNNRPATREEIEKHLIQEAKRRGYKGGNTIKGIHRTTHKRPEIRSFRYDPEGDRLLTNVTCVVYEKGQWAEIVEQPAKVKLKTNPIHYTVDGTTYSLDYQDLKLTYDGIVSLNDEDFMQLLPQIAHFACIVSYFKGLGVQATISDKGIIHELIHLMTDPEEPTNDLTEIRLKFNKLIQLV